MRRAIVLAAVALSSCRSHDAGDVGAIDASSPRVDPDAWLEAVTELPPANNPLSTTLVGRFGGGVCALDVDGDDTIDLFFPGMADGGGPSRLWLARPNGDHAIRFVDETASRGLSDVEGTGCVAADLDGDGDRDLVVVGRGVARLFVNDHGSFAEDSGRLTTAIGRDTFASAVVAFDADGDGDLDLAIATYGRYEPPATCGNFSCALDPTAWKHGSTRLLLQSPSGDFVDASERLGPVRDEPGLTLLATDLDDDGALDLFVGNDLGSPPDRYLKNDGKGSFVDVGAALGVATAATTKGVCTMSTTDGDVDGDGALDLVESNWATEPSVIFRCAGTCRDISDELELFRKPLNLRWGQALVDFDHDGIPELVEAVGHLYDTTDFLRLDDAPEGTGQLRAAPILYSRDAFTSPFVLQQAKLGLATQTCGRGLVVLDLDADGDLDVVVGSACGSPLVLANVREKRGNALDLRLVGKGRNRDAIGAKVVARAGGRTWAAMVHAGDGFHGSGDGRVHFGLGAATEAELTIRWPDGAISRHRAVPGSSKIAQP